MEGDEVVEEGMTRDGGVPDRDTERGAAVAAVVVAVAEAVVAVEGTAVDEVAG